MIKLENEHVYNIVGAVYSARNAMNSWDKSDSNFESDKLGENDLKLAKKLSKSGSDHAKYLRMITVTVDITAPIYFWKQFDQYKVGTVTNSTSTMHKIHAKEFTLEDFSCEHLINEPFPVTDEYVETYLDCMTDTIKALNCARRMFLETKDKKYWWQLIQLLPSSYNQKRTVLLNYQVLKNMYHARKNHKLDCWIEFCRWCETLPYFKEVCINA